VVLGEPAVFGDLLKIDALAGTQHPAACGELVIGEQAGLDPLGQLDLLPGVEQLYLADQLEVVLNRVGGSPGGCHPDGGKVLAGNQRLVLALLTRRLQRAAGSSRAGALAGAWLVLTARLLRSAQRHVVARHRRQAEDGLVLDQQEHRVGRVRTADPDPMRGAAGLDGLKRIDRHHGYAVVNVGTWPVAWARRLAAAGS
jgi:hypothetical protein